MGRHGYNADGTPEDVYECDGCHQAVAEVCGGMYCRDCHVSLSFESCVDGSWNRAQWAAIGMAEVYDGMSPPNEGGEEK